MLIVPSSPSTRSTSSRWSGDALSASISKAMFSSDSAYSFRSVIESFALFICRSYRNGDGTKSASERYSSHKGRGLYQEDRVMKRLVLASAIAASVSLAGCATNPYGNGYTYDDQGRRVATGAAI